MVLEDRYVLLREIARGGMCVVHAARHLFTDRTVALKVLVGGGGADDVLRARLVREARVLGRLVHPHVVEVLDGGLTDAGEPFLVMEMLEGRTLEGVLLAQRRLPVALVARIARDLCAAMTAVHAAGVLHRDIKPSNVIIARNAMGKDELKLIDFGIAAPLVAPEGGRALTKIGEFVGTPEYTAPERLLLGPEADARSDVYAVAAVLFECLTGRAPFEGSYGEIVAKSAMGEAPLASDLAEGVPEVVARSLAQGLVADPRRRFRSIAALGRAFDEAVRAAPALAIAPPTSLRFDDRTAPIDLEAAPPPSVSWQDAIALRRRKHVRVPYVTPVRIVADMGLVIDGRTEDLSEGGMLVLVRTAVAMALERVEVRFALPLTGEQVSLEAKAKWLHDARGRAVIGLAFGPLPDAVRAVVARYVDAMETAGRETA